MKNLRSIICLLLAGSLMFSVACGKKEKSEDDTGFGAGRYIETDITPPIDGQFMSFLSNDGIIVCYDSELKIRYESADGGGSWSNTPGPGNGSDRYRLIQGSTLLSDGSMLVFLQGEGLEVVAPDGSSIHYPVGEIDEALGNGENVYVSLLQALGNRILLSYMIGGFMQTVRSGGQANGNATFGEQPSGQSGGQPDRQFGEQSGGQSGGQPDRQFGGQPGEQSDRQFGGQPGEQSGGQPDRQFGEQPGEQSGGQPDRQFGEQPDEQSGGQPDRQFGGQSGGQPDRQIGGQPGGSSRGATASPLTAKTLLCDIAGHVLNEIAVENASAATSDGDYLYLLDSSGSAAVYNLKDGSPSSKPEVIFTAAQDTQGMGNMRGFAMRLGGGSGSTLALGNDGDLYAALGGSLLRADLNGNVSTVLESTAYSIGAPRSNVSSVFMLADNSIVVNLLDSGQTNRLYKYIWNETATVDPEKTLTVWSLQDNSFVRAAISELRKSYPDSLITYEVALSGNSAVSASDAIKTLNTQLLGGNGPDIILLDDCSADSYADRGMLLDLSNLINTGDIFDSLLDPYVNNGKLFYLPAQFLMPMLMGSADALSDVQSLDDLVSIVVNGNVLPASGGGGARPFSGVAESERAALYFTDLKELCNIMWISCAPDIVRNNQLDTNALRRYLEAIKAISDKYGMAEQTTGRGGMGLSIAFSDGGVATALPGSLMWYTMQLTHYAAFSAGNLQLLQMMMDRAGSTLELFPGLTRGAWQPSTVVGISVDAKNQPFAGELVQAMLSVTVQQLNYGAGLPVTRAGLAAQISAINERRIENGEEPFSFDPNSLIDQLQSPSMGDTVLYDMMWNSIEKCCNDEIDVEGAVKEIEQNVKNYLAERA